MGDNVKLTCTATSSESPITYKWFVNGTQISDEVTMEYTISSGQTSNDGSYTCEVDADSFTEKKSDAKAIKFIKTCKYLYKM